MTKVFPRNILLEMKLHPLSKIYRVLVKPLKDPFQFIIMKSNPWLYSEIFSVKQIRTTGSKYSNFNSDFHL